MFRNLPQNSNITEYDWNVMISKPFNQLFDDNL